MEFSNEAIFLLIQLSTFTCMEKVDKIQYFIRTAQTDKHIRILSTQTHNHTNTRSRFILLEFMFNLIL